MFCLRICVMWFSVCTCFLIKPVANIGFVMSVLVYVRLLTSSSSVPTGRLFAKILYRGMFTNIFRRFQLSLKWKSIKITGSVHEDVLTFMNAWLKRCCWSQKLPTSCGSYDYAKALEFLSLCVNFMCFRLVKSVFYY